ncbi:MAG TPA: hypothetical protein VFR43_05290 [Gaiellaceae bacterium]|nr:hypothetical protein [Gaiellaceae bacterium]
MKRIVLTMLCAAVGCAAAGAAAQTAQGATVCVGATPTCFPTIQAAVDAAQDGDTIELGPGTFAGGITIDKSVELVGAGAAATIVAGGGPVITIGEVFGTAEQTVSISRVTITGGLNNSQPDEQVTFGGGIWVPSSGATVTIADSVITGNRVTPQSTVPPGEFCGPFPCAFALGGGIDNAGTLTVTNTRITDNEVGSTKALPSVASGAFGGGIVNREDASLTLRRSVVAGNRVAVTSPNGRLAVAGGISDTGALVVEDSVVSGNDVVVDASFQDEVNAFTGGIEVTQSGAATIVRTAVNGNSVRAANAGGAVLAGVGGISTDEDVSLVLRNSSVSQNSVSVSVSPEGANAVAFAGGLEIEGAVEVSGSRFVANNVRASGPSGLVASAGGGIFAEALAPVSVSDSFVIGNSVEASTTGGFVIAQGAGVLNAGQLTLRRTLVAANRASATGPAGLAQGGGVWNGLIELPGFPEVVELALVDSAVLGNGLSASSDVAIQGGGLFTTAPLTLTGTLIAGNRPDQCFGC